MHPKRLSRHSIDLSTEKVQFTEPVILVLENNSVRFLLDNLGCADFWSISCLVWQDFAQGRLVFELWSEATTDDIITIDHALHQLTLDVTVWHSSIDQEPLAFLKSDDVHQKRENDSNIVAILLNKNQTELLM